jgi:hypothetical protein
MKNARSGSRSGNTGERRTYSENKNQKKSDEARDGWHRNPKRLALLVRNDFILWREGGFGQTKKMPPKGPGPSGMAAGRKEAQFILFLRVTATIIVL